MADDDQMFYETSINNQHYWIIKIIELRSWPQLSSALLSNEDTTARTEFYVNSRVIFDIVFSLLQFRFLFDSFEGKQRKNGRRDHEVMVVEKKSHRKWIWKKKTLNKWYPTDQQRMRLKMWVDLHEKDVFTCPFLCLFFPSGSYKADVNRRRLILNRAQESSTAEKSSWCRRLLRTYAVCAVSGQIANQVNNGAYNEVKCMLRRRGICPSERVVTLAQWFDVFMVALYSPFRNPLHRRRDCVCIYHIRTHSVHIGVRPTRSSTEWHFSSGGSNSATRCRIAYACKCMYASCGVKTS